MQIDEIIMHKLEYDVCIISHYDKYSDETLLPLLLLLSFPRYW